ALGTDHWIDAGRNVLRVAIAATTLIKTRAALRARLLTHRAQLVRTAIATIGMAAGEQLFSDLPVSRGAGELEDNLSIPVQPQPRQAIDDGVDRRGRGPLAVRIFDPQKHLAAMPPGVEPIEQGSPAAADVKKACRGRSKSGDNFGVHIRVRLNPRLLQYVAPRPCIITFGSVLAISCLRRQNPVDELSLNVTRSCGCDDRPASADANSYRALVTDGWQDFSSQLKSGRDAAASAGARLASCCHSARATA